MYAVINAFGIVGDGAADHFGLFMDFLFHEMAVIAPPPPSRPARGWSRRVRLGRSAGLPDRSSTLTPKPARITAIVPVFKEEDAPGVPGQGQRVGAQIGFAFPRSRQNPEARPCVRRGSGRARPLP